jgi:tripartite-type tricarboxylate transporter receptor subunit TctC
MKTVGSPDIRSKLEGIGALPVGDKPAEFAARIKREYDQAAKIVKTAGVRIE